MSVPMIAADFPVREGVVVLSERPVTIVKEILPAGGTSLEIARGLAWDTEARRYASSEGYMAESELRTNAMAQATAEAIARNEDFCQRLDAAQAEAAAKEARNHAQDLEYYHQATATRRWPVSCVSTRWGVRQAPY
ncbi:hypothetical protein DIPPA_09467 [Diplonema papillatum]|nr:hypothetical protein DIPPA_09467 [Diplonema papillatum]